MVENIRRFKGVRAVDKGTGSVDIDMAGDLSEFDSVGPEYLDTTGDVTHRDSKLISGEAVVNDSGRNDIVRVKVSKTDKYTYFLAECASDIVAGKAPNWMNLFIDSDQSRQSGWEGYDFIIGRTLEDGKLSVEEFTDTSWKGYNKGWAEFTVSGNKMAVRIESEIIDLGGRDNFDFKWADNSTVSGEVMEFMDLGDAAPNSRFNYRYIKEGGTISHSIRSSSQVSDNDGSESKGLDGPVIAVIITTLLAVAAAVVFVISNNKKKEVKSNEKD